MRWTVGGIQKGMDDIYTSETNQYSHADDVIKEDELQSMNCEGPNTNTHKIDGGAVEHRHAAG